MGETLKNSLLIGCLLLLLLHDFSKHAEHDSEGSLHLGEVHAARHIEESVKSQLLFSEIPLLNNLYFLRIIIVPCTGEDDLVVASDLLFSELGEISQFPLKIIRHLCDVLFRISVSALVEHNISYLFLS